MSNSLQAHGLQHSRLPWPSLSPQVCSNLCPLSWWCHPTVSFSVILFSSCPQSFPASGSFPVSQFFASACQSVGASASVFPIFRINFLYDWLVWSPCSPRDSQESSPAPRLESISSWALSLFHCPGLTSMHDSWRTHSFDYMDLCWQSDVSAF